MEEFNPAIQLQDYHLSNEFGGVNPSISDSSTYIFPDADSMSDTFQGKTEGYFLYSRHTSPSTLFLAEALAKMEGAESANVTASGMAAIVCSILQFCKSGDEIVSSRTIYGGTYAFMKNFLPKYQIRTSFVDITDLQKVEAAITDRTRIIYCETISNPLLEVANLTKLSELCKKYNLKLVVDNTFSPLMISPARFGADAVVHSLTKFINGSSDALGGVVCGNYEFINNLKDVDNGACMLLGPTMDSHRAASILKNLRTLPLRMAQHSKNAQYLSENFIRDGLKVNYPGLPGHRDHALLGTMLNKDFGYGGVMTVDLGTAEMANKAMVLWQRQNLGYLAVSLGFYKTLFCISGSSTSSEIPLEEQRQMGLSPGLVRISVGLDHDIGRTYGMMRDSLRQAGAL